MPSDKISKTVWSFDYILLITPLGATIKWQTMFST